MSRPALPLRDYVHGSHPISNNYPSYHRGLPRDEYFRYDRDMDVPSWRQYLVNSQRYPHGPPGPPMLPYSVSPLRSRRFV